MLAQADWRALSYDGTEHIRMDVKNAKVKNTSRIEWRDNFGKPRLTVYTIEFTKDMRNIVIAIEDGQNKLNLKKQKELWFNGAGKTLPQLSGCSVLDFEATPFTNILPMNLLKKKVDFKHQLRVVYITFPELDFYPVEQTYTYRGNNQWIFEQPEDNFTAFIHTDKNNLITDYPGLFQRV